MRCFGHLQGGHRIEDSKRILVRAEPPNTLLIIFQTLSSFLVRDSRIYKDRQYELAVTLINYTKHIKSFIIISIASVTIHYFMLVAAYTSPNLVIFTCLLHTSSYHIEFWLCIIEVPVSVDLVTASGGRRLCC